MSKNFRLKILVGTLTFLSLSLSCTNLRRPLASKLFMQLRVVLLLHVLVCFPFQINTLIIGLIINSSTDKQANVVSNKTNYDSRIFISNFYRETKDDESTLLMHRRRHRIVLRLRERN